MVLDSFGTRSTLTVGARRVGFHSLQALKRQGVGHVDRLPLSIKILLENKDGTFKPGMPATARIVTDSAPAQATAQ